MASKKKGELTKAGVPAKPTLPLNTVQRAEAEAFVWKWRRMGRTQETIRDMMARPVEEGGLGISVTQAAISKMQERQEAKLITRFTGEAAALKAEQTAQLQYVAEQSIEAWEESRKPGIKENESTKSLAAKSKGDAKEGKPFPIGEGGYETTGMYLDHDSGEETDPESQAALIQKALSAGDIGGALSIIEKQVRREVRYQTGDPRYLGEFRQALADIRRIWGLDAPQKQEIAGPGGGAIPLHFEADLKRVYGDAPEPPQAVKPNALPAYPDTYPDEYPTGDDTPTDAF